MIQRIPDPNVVFPNSYGTTCFLKNVITAPNILVGDYTYYDDPVDPTGFEKIMCCLTGQNLVTD